MIKLIASDMDGTLLPEGTPDINPEIFEIIGRLKEKGIIFAAASGRQYDSMRTVFQSVQNDMIFIAENGGYVVCRGYDMYRGHFETEIFQEVMDYIRQQNCFSIVNTPEAAYTDSRDDEMVKRIREGYNLNLRQVDDVMKLDLDVVKGAFYSNADALVTSEAAQKIFEGKAKVMASGDRWVDFMPLSVNKGTALNRIQQQLNIKVEETMAFGDNYNDIDMLNQAGESYAMENARDGVKQAAKHIAGRNDEDGVLKVLKDLLASMEQ